MSVADGAYSDRVPSAIFFLAGGLTTSGWSRLEVVWPYFAVGFALALVLARPLDRLALGDDVAASLGARPRADPPRRGRAAALLAASAAAHRRACSAFLGLFIPHVVRLAARHRRATLRRSRLARCAARRCCSPATRSRARCWRRSSCRSGR